MSSVLQILTPGHLAYLFLESFGQSFLFTSDGLIVTDFGHDDLESLLRGVIEEQGICSSYEQVLLQWSCSEDLEHLSMQLDYRFCIVPTSTHLMRVTFLHIDQSFVFEVSLLHPALKGE